MAAGHFQNTINSSYHSKPPSAARPRSSKDSRLHCNCAELAPKSFFLSSELAECPIQKASSNDNLSIEFFWPTSSCFLWPHVRLHTPCDGYPSFEKAGGRGIPEPLVSLWGSILDPEGCLPNQAYCIQVYFTLWGHGGSIDRASASRSNGLHDQRFESRPEHKKKN